jgi:hypothetical protein
MGTSTTARGAMAIPGEAEADWIFTAGFASITPVRWPEYTLLLGSRGFKVADYLKLRSIYNSIFFVPNLPHAAENVDIVSYNFFWRNTRPPTKRECESECKEWKGR